MTSWASPLYHKEPKDDKHLGNNKVTAMQISYKW